MPQTLDAPIHAESAHLHLQNVLGLGDYCNLNDDQIY